MTDNRCGKGNKEEFGVTYYYCNKYEGRLLSSWTGGSAPLLCRRRRWLLCQVV